MSATIKQLIINSPYEEPERHLKYNRETRAADVIDRRLRPPFVKAE